ncbi:unnamed protein product, partial [Allacma fusca]
MLTPTIHPHVNIRSEISKLLNIGKQIPIEIPRPIFSNATKDRVEDVTLKSTEGPVTELPLEISTTMPRTEQKSSTEPEDLLESTTLPEKEEETVTILNGHEQNGTDEGKLAPPVDTIAENYNQKLQLVLANIQKILPALVQLQENMTELLEHSKSREFEITEIQVEDPSVYSVSV